MKRIKIHPIDQIPGQSMGAQGFVYKPIIAPTSPEAQGCHIAFVEVPPQGASFAYHYHEMDEEAFYIISGRGLVRTPYGQIEVRPGDAVTFPAGPEGAHAISNPSKTEKQVYIDFDTHHLPEITHFPDTGAVEVLGPFSATVYEQGQGVPSQNPRRRSE